MVAFLAYLVLGVMSVFEKDCQNGDWLTCSGEVTYSTAGRVLILGQFLIPLLIFFGNFLLLEITGGSLGKRRNGLRVVDNRTGETVSRGRLVLRASLNVALLLSGIAALTYGFVTAPLLVGVVLVILGKRRLLDLALRTDVR